MVLWVQRSVRGRENAALDLAIARANAAGVPLLAVFGLTTTFPQATARAFSFLCDGLADAALAMALRGVRLAVLKASPADAVLGLCAGAGGALLSPESRPVEIVVDAGYLRICQSWRAAVAAACGCPLRVVHADVTVPPARAASRALDRAASLRPALRRLAPSFASTFTPGDAVSLVRPSLGRSLDEIVSGTAAAPGVAGTELAEADLLGPPLHAALRRACHGVAPPPTPAAMLASIGLLPSAEPERPPAARWNQVWGAVAASLWAAVRAGLSDEALRTPPVECMRGGHAQAIAWMSRFAGPPDGAKAAADRPAPELDTPRLASPACGVDPSLMMRHGALLRYASSRNDPHARSTSLMSAYLHFGHAGPLDLLGVARRSAARPSDLERWEDELVTWREMAVHVVVSRPAVYDTFRVLPEWARRTLKEHAGDPRPRLVALEDLARARSGDAVWDLAQAEGMVFGRMHGYFRMYWAKRLLEWTSSPQQAFHWALRLNNRFFLDGRDAASYLGVAWCFGLADKPRGDSGGRRVFGALRGPSPAVGRRVDIPRVAEQVLEACRCARDPSLRELIAPLLDPALGIARLARSPSAAAQRGIASFFAARAEKRPPSAPGGHVSLPAAAPADGEVLDPSKRAKPAT